MRMTGVRFSSRTTSMRSPSIGRSAAQPRKSSTARSMWPCSRHWASNIGDLAGIFTYSCRVGTMLSSHVFWTKSRILPESSGMGAPQEAMRRPERISQSSWSSSGASAMRASLPQRRQWMNAGSRPTYVLSHLGHRACGAARNRLAVRCSVCSGVRRMTVAGAASGFRFARFAFASFMGVGHCSVVLGRMRVGIVLDGRRSAAEIAELARLAESYGFSHLWLSGGARTKDHFVRLALAAAATRTIRLGPVAVSPFEMHPAHIGLALLTLDEIAPGRACVVLGAGGDLAATLEAPTRGRVEAVEECLDILRAQAAGGEINYAGKHYRVTGLFSPWGRVAMDRLYLGANRPRMLRLAARKADGVMVTDMPLAYLGGLVARIRAELAEARREPGAFVLNNWFVWNVQDTRAEAERLARRGLCVSSVLHPRHRVLDRARGR